MDAVKDESVKSSKKRRKLYSAEWKKKNAQRNVEHSQKYYQRNRTRILSVLRAKYREDTERRERIKKERLERKYRNDPARGLYYESDDEKLLDKCRKAIARTDGETEIE